MAVGMNTMLEFRPPANVTKRFVASPGVSPPPTMISHPFSGPAVCAAKTVGMAPPKAQ